MKSSTTIEQLESYCESMFDRLLSKVVSLELEIDKLKRSEKIDAEDWFIRFKNHIEESDWKKEN